MSRYLDEVAKRLVAFDTTSSRSNVAATDYLAGEFENHGFRVRIQRIEVAGVPKANLVAWAGPPVPDGLIICGHIDTVPFEGQPGWQRDPLQLEIGTSRVYGRGTSDMKVFIAQCVNAAAELDLASLNKPLVFAFTADEEVGSFGAAQLAPMLAGILGDTPMPRLAWIGEPTSLQIFHAHKGVVRFRITVHGIGGHSSLPEQGVNAIAVAGKVIDTIGRYQSELRRLRSPEYSAMFADCPYTTLNFGTVAGGTASNVIAEQCSIDISYRPLPGSDPLDVYRETIKRAQDLDPHDYCSPDRIATITFGEPVVVEALLATRGTPIERALCDVLRTATVSGALFATDGPNLAAVGIESIICGPGELEQAHQPNESLARDAYENGTSLILSVISTYGRMAA